MNARRVQLVCAWCGPIFCALYGLGMVPLAGFLPPPTAHDSAAEVVELYSEHNDRLQIGLSIMLLATLFFAPFVGAISEKIKQIEGKASTLSYAQLAAGAAQVIIVLSPIMVMVTASFRPERDPALTQALNDLAWIQFVMAFTPIAAQMAIVAMAAFIPGQNQFPRWVGYFSAWCVLLLMPQLLVPFFKTGPFAWHGALEFWLAANVFFGWIVVMSLMLIRQPSASTLECPNSR